MTYGYCFVSRDDVRFVVASPRCRSCTKLGTTGRGRGNLHVVFFFEAVPWIAGLEMQTATTLCHTARGLKAYCSLAKGLAVTAQRVVQEARNKACCDRPGFVFASPRCRRCTKLRSTGRGRGNLPLSNFHPNPLILYQYQSSARSFISELIDLMSLSLYALDLALICFSRLMADIISPPHSK